MLIGATMNTADLPTLSVGLAGNNIMRIFPSNATVAGKATKVLPAWSDQRFAYCQKVGAIPFVSTKVDGDPDAVAYVRAQLLTLPDWIKVLFITDRHEPEGDVTAQQFQANFTAFLKMVDGLPAALRRRIRCGPVLTRTWTEQNGTGRTYDTYDPGTGDFFGVDMYVQSGTAKAVVTPASMPSPPAFTAEFKAYRKNADDHRDRLWPEWGLIGMPDDPDGTARAGWIRGNYQLVKTWDPAVLGWKFIGMIWWNSAGKATGEVAQIGQRRDFPLSQRTLPAPAVGFAAGSSAAATAVVLPGDPPAPVAAFNSIFIAENPPTPAPGPAPTPIPAPAGTYDDGWRAGRAQLLKEISALVDGSPAP
jgi:hypothetical protein